MLKKILDGFSSTERSSLGTTKHASSTNAELCILFRVQYVHKRTKIALNILVRFTSSASAKIFNDQLKVWLSDWKKHSSQRESLTIFPKATGSLSDLQTEQTKKAVEPSQFKDEVVTQLALQD
jgi:hypothetical protein